MHSIPIKHKKQIKKTFEITKDIDIITGVMNFNPFGTQASSEGVVKMHLIKRRSREYKTIAKSRYFDKKWYLKTYPDVAAAKADPVEHYLNFGWKEGRDPSQQFSTNGYLLNNPDVKDANINPLVHWENAGMRENRVIFVKENLSFTKYELIKQTDDVLKFPEFKNIQVSIIIPVYNNWDYTKLCLQSILNNTDGVSYEVIIADDNSNDKTQDIKKYVKNIKVVRNDINLRFLKNCNNAAKHAVGEYIMFLNNDTQVQKGWLRYLVEEMEKDPTVGLVGSKLIYPDGTLQEAGGIIYSDATGCNYGKNDNPDFLWYNYKKEVDYISGASILLRTSLWQKLGGFDENFAPAYYEDTDLAFRVRYNEGLKVVYVPKSLVVHFEGKSNGTDTSSGQKKYQVINKEKFFQKWKKQLFAYHSRPTINNFLARDYAVAKKNILVIDWKILSFTKDTGSRATYQYMQFFRKMGFNVKLFPHDWYLEDDYLQRHLEDGFEVIKQGFADYIQNFGSQFDYIYLNRPNIAKYYIDLLRKYTRAKIIYQCHDLHYLRQYRNRLLTNESDAITCFESEKKDEFSIFNKMDLTCTFSFDEVKEIEKEDPHVNARQIPLYILDSNVMQQYKYNAKDRKDIMFVAGFQHTPNIDAAVWFANNIFPEIKKHTKNVKLYLVGSKPSDEVLALASDDIIVTGFVTDEELDKYYEKIKLVVVPLRTGAGVKGKIIESVYHKVPVVTTDIGIEGIDNTDNNIIVKNSEKDFADTVNELYKNNAELQKLSDKSKDFIQKHFSEEAVKKALGDYIEF